MPELPEVETMRRGIAGIAGATIAGRGSPALPPPADRDRAADARRGALRASGSKKWAAWESGSSCGWTSEDRLIFEPRMTGLVLVADPPSQEHLRFRLDLADGPIPQRLVLGPPRPGLGPPARASSNSRSSSATVSSAPMPWRCRATSCVERLATSRRAIKVALLDQRAVAGIGNLYASEILHLAGVHPAKRCDLLSAGQWQAIHARMLEVLETAIAPRRLDALRRHLPQRPQPGRRLSEPAPRLRPGRRDSACQCGRTDNRPHRPGPAGHVLLPDMPDQAAAMN